MKKNLYLIIISIALASFSLAASSVSASAATERIARPIVYHEQMMPNYRAYWPARRPWWWHMPHRGAPREINQFRWGDSYHNDPVHNYGHDIGNTGNSGYNRGRNEDNDTSNGNQIIHPSGLRGIQRVNQYSYGSNNYNNSTWHYGYNQLNAGNSGKNDGLNQDNSSNGGNQIIG